MASSREVGRFAEGEVFAERYRVERLLKAGGMGAVYVAQHVRTHEHLALKLMRPELVALPGAAAKFEQEARVGTLVNSPGVVRVIDAGVDAATAMPFLVMELLRGRELGDMLAVEGRLDAERSLRYLAQTARTLDKAHAAGVIHRDLKPENLFVVEATDEEPERVKILDFGIAKLVQAATDASTQAQGTPLYMAPEQTRRGDIGPAADIWPLGLIAYVMLVGAPYWEAESVAQLYGEILAGSYASPQARARRVGVELPEGFDAWFFRCVALDPARRFARATEATHALARVLGQAHPSGLDIAFAETMASAPMGVSPRPAAPARGAVVRSLRAPAVAALFAIAFAVGFAVVRARKHATVAKLAPVATAPLGSATATGALGSASPGNVFPESIAAAHAAASRARAVIAGDHPDPHVLRVLEGGAAMYYLVATVGNAGDLPVWRSRDLAQWEQLPDKLLRRASSPGSSLALHDRHYCSIWAPEIVALPSGFMLHFTAQRFSSPQSPCPPYREDSGIYFASSLSPTGPFARDDRPWEPLAAGGHVDCKLRDRMPRAPDLASTPCRGSGCMRLDSHVVVDQDRWWLAYSWFSDDQKTLGQHVGMVRLDGRDPYTLPCVDHAEVVALQSPQDQATLGRLRSACPRCAEMLSFTKGREGEEIMRMGASFGIVEGPSIFRRKGMVYALLSHSGWNSAYYSVMWIGAPSVEGLASDNPERLVGRYLVPSKDQSFGHGAPVLGPDGEHWYYVHHHLDHTACIANGNCSRDVWLSPIEFEDKGDGRGDVWIKAVFPAERGEAQGL